jgi:hypothetical protein
MRDRLRWSVHTLAVIASLVLALSLAGLGTSHAAAAKSPSPAYVNEQPCNDLCKAYLNWSRRVTAMLQPAPAAKTTAVRPGPPPRMLVDHVPTPRRPALNSFAQLPSRSVARPAIVDAPLVAATPQAEIAPSRSGRDVADQFPATREFMTAMRYGDGGTRDASGTTVGVAAGTAAAIQASSTVDAFAGALDIGRAALLLFGCLTLPALLLLWRQSRRGVGRNRPPARAAAEARSKPGRMQLAPDF